MFQSSAAPSAVLSSGENEIHLKRAWRRWSLCLPFLHFFQIGIPLLWREYCSSQSACRICCSHCVSSSAGCQLISSTLTSPPNTPTSPLVSKSVLGRCDRAFLLLVPGRWGSRSQEVWRSCKLLPPSQPNLWAAAAAGLHFMQKLASCCCSCSHCLSTAGTLLTLDTGNPKCCSLEGNETFLYSHLF